MRHKRCRIRRRRPVCWPNGTARRTSGTSCGAISSPKSLAPAEFTATKTPQPIRSGAIGWDHRSLIFQVLDKGQLARLSFAQRLAFLRWRARLEHRMAAHPRNRRQRNADDHARHVLALSQDVFGGQFCRHLLPRSNYLKVIGDFARWNDKRRFRLRRHREK